MKAFVLILFEHVNITFPVQENGHLQDLKIDKDIKN